MVDINHRTIYKLLKEKNCVTRCADRIFIARSLGGCLFGNGASPWACKTEPRLWLRGAGFKSQACFRLHSQDLGLQTLLWEWASNQVLGRHTCSLTMARRGQAELQGCFRVCGQAGWQAHLWRCEQLLWQFQNILSDGVPGLGLALGAPDCAKRGWSWVTDDFRVHSQD